MVSAVNSTCGTEAEAAAEDDAEAEAEAGSVRSHFSDRGSEVSVV